MKQRKIYSNAAFDTEDPDYIDPGDYFSRASKERMAKAVKEHGPLIDNDRYQDDIDRAGGYDRYIAREKKHRSIYSSQNSATNELAEIMNKIRHSHISGRYIYGKISEAVSTQSEDYVYGFIFGLTTMGDIYNDSYYGVDELSWWIDETPNWFNYLKSYVNSNR